VIKGEDSVIARHCRLTFRGVRSISASREVWSVIHGCAVKRPGFIQVASYPPHRPGTTGQSLTGSGGPCAARKESFTVRSPEPWAVLTLTDERQDVIRLLAPGGSLSGAPAGMELVMDKASPWFCGSCDARREGLRRLPDLLREPEIR